MTLSSDEQNRVSEFERWMQKVNRHLDLMCGLSASDLPDCNYYAWFEDHWTPREAAELALYEADYSE